MLCASSWDDDAELLEEGREALRKKDFKLLAASRGDFGALEAVRGEKPEGGFDVRIVGGQAASSLRSTSSSWSRSSGCWGKAPYSIPKLPCLGELPRELGTDRLGFSKWLEARFEMTSRLVIKDEMISGEAGGMFTWLRSLLLSVARSMRKCSEGSIPFR